MFFVGCVVCLLVPSLVLPYQTFSLRNYLLTFFVKRSHEEHTNYGLNKKHYFNNVEHGTQTFASLVNI